MIWILIFSVYSSVAISSGTAEFNTKEACDRAGQELGSILRSEYICVEKGRSDGQVY